MEEIIIGEWLKLKLLDEAETMFFSNDIDSLVGRLNIKKKRNQI